MEREREKKILSVVSRSKHLQCPRIGQLEARARNFIKVSHMGTWVQARGSPSVVYSVAQAGNQTAGGAACTQISTQMGSADLASAEHSVLPCQSQDGLYTHIQCE